MATIQVNISFPKMVEAFEKHVRSKAVRFGSTIVYIQKGQLIEEDPRTSKKVILKDLFE